MSTRKPSSEKTNPTGRYATAEEANRAKNADLIATIKKMNLKIMNGRPTLPKQQ